MLQSTSAAFVIQALANQDSHSFLPKTLPTIIGSCFGSCYGSSCLRALLVLNSRPFVLTLGGFLGFDEEFDFYFIFVPLPIALLVLVVFGLASDLQLWGLFESVSYVSVVSFFSVGIYILCDLAVLIIFSVNVLPLVFCFQCPAIIFCRRIFFLVQSYFYQYYYQYYFYSCSIDSARVFFLKFNLRDLVFCSLLLFVACGPFPLFFVLGGFLYYYQCYCYVLFSPFYYLSYLYPVFIIFFLGCSLAQ